MEIARTAVRVARAAGARISCNSSLASRENFLSSRRSFASSAVGASSWAPPPGLRRLPLSEQNLAAVIECGRRDGPLAAHGLLVRDGFLDTDSAQAKCATRLQEMWEALAAHRKAHKIWEGEHAEWRKAHASWQEAHEAWKSAVAEQAEAAKAPEAEASLATADKIADKQPLEPQEPVEPRAPELASHGCFVWGRVGGGKSLLMDLFVESCGGVSAQNGLSVKRAHFHEFMHGVQRELHQMRQSLGPGEDRTTRAVARRLAADSVRVLAFDEFQLTNISDALIAETLLDALFAEGVAVLMTSNRPPEDLYKDGLNRHLVVPQLLSLFDRRNIVYHELSAGRDFRAAPARLSDDMVLDDTVAKGPWRDFFCDPGEAELKSAFAAAAGGQNGGPAEVSIGWGRKMQVGEVADGVGRFTFDQLCGQALNADDYLQLVGQFHTFVVADVPVFSLEQHNEARRFTNLIDCLYERHARLILSAAAPPTQLLANMEVLATVSLKKNDGAPEPAAAVPGGYASPDWIRNNPWSPQPAMVTEAVTAAAQQEPALVTEAVNAAAQTVGVRPGDDDSAPHVGVAGVMAGALGSLQESGFAARRATSRLLHMQTDDYLQAHRRHCLGVPSA
eukprot:gnl/TRDRNA2_/TRDRNA2_163050_c0_seq1.p1 gnl/TRDRNA2_/TRDRNA2_163050_c0~~gnl/TRDRNA2_/TRDRNA2_163050_c0_seq1.p1  ORF type:complete len:619 (+),score=127.46 gnl/TRDRNA2_/TRDRNA2_163050_c0_seq1:53-1909(+)